MAAVFKASATSSLIFESGTREPAREAARDASSFSPSTIVNNPDPGTVGGGGVAGGISSIAPFFPLPARPLCGLLVASYQTSYGTSIIFGLLPGL